MTRESREPTTTETLQTRLESTYETAREKLESGYETARTKLESAVETLRSELDSRLGPAAGSRNADGTAVTVESGPSASAERGADEPSTASAADEPPTTATEPVEQETAGSVVDDAVETSAPEPEGGDEPVESLSGIGPAYADRLGEAGVETVGDLAAADAASVAEATGVGEGRVSSWIEQAKGE